MGELRIQQNMKCVATKTVAAQRPIADRELAGLDDGMRKSVEKRHWDGRARLSAIAVRFAEDGDIARLMSGIAHNYIWDQCKTL